MWLFVITKCRRDVSKTLLADPEFGVLFGFRKSKVVLFGMQSDSHIGKVVLIPLIKISVAHLSLVIWSEPLGGSRMSLRRFCGLRGLFTWMHRGGWLPALLRFLATRFRSQWNL